MAQALGRLSALLAVEATVMDAPGNPVVSELQAPEPGEFRIYETEDGRTRVDTIWLSRAMMAELFQTSPQNITPHLKARAEGALRGRENHPGGNL